MPTHANLLRTILHFQSQKRHQLTPHLQSSLVTSLIPWNRFSWLRTVNLRSNKPKNWLQTNTGKGLVESLCVYVNFCLLRVLTCLLAHVCGQVRRTRAEVLVAVWQEGCQRVHPVRLLHHRHFVGLLDETQGWRVRGL